MGGGGGDFKLDFNREVNILKVGGGGDFQKHGCPPPFSAYGPEDSYSYAGTAQWTME